MKKCILLFAILVITILLAVLTDKTNQTIPGADNKFAIEGNENFDLLAEGEISKETRIKE
ncbi:MAG: hypothetical protein WBG90_06445 [Saonia sp.]